MGVSGKSPSRNHFSWLCIAILCIGFWLRVSGPHMSSFWLDEVHSVERASLPNWATYVENTIRTGHGPVYEWGVLRSWIRLGYNEFCVRFPIVLLGVLNNAIIFVIGRRLFGKRVALLSGTVFALSSYHIVFSYEARPYVLAAFWMSLTLLFFTKIFIYGDDRRRNHKLKYLGYVIFATLSLYTHYTSALQLFVFAAWGVGQALLRRDGRLLRNWVLAQISVFLLFLPWFGLYVMRLERQLAPWIPSRSIWEMLRFIPQVYWHPKVFDWSAICVLFGGVTFAALFILRGAFKRKLANLNLDRWIFLAVAAWAPVLLGILASLFWRPLFVSRYFLYVISSASLFMGWVLSVLLRQRRFYGMLIVLLVVGSMLVSSYGWTRKNLKEDWRGLTAYLQSHSQPDSMVLLSTSHLVTPFDYYNKEALHVRAMYGTNTDA